MKGFTWSHPAHKKLMKYYSTGDHHICGARILRSLYSEGMATYDTPDKMVNQLLARIVEGDSWIYIYEVVGHNPLQVYMSQYTDRASIAKGLLQEPKFEAFMKDVLRRSLEKETGVIMDGIINGKFYDHVRQELLKKFTALLQALKEDENENACETQEDAA